MPNRRLFDHIGTQKVTAPTIVGWNRLEPRPRSEDFSRSLRAEVRDALWMLARQWQMGEFQGEDGGSPVDARILTEENTINRFAAVNGNARSFDDSLPLEARVEKQNVADSLKLRLQISAQFNRILSDQTFSTDPLTSIRTRYKSALPADPELLAQLQCDQDSMQLYTQLERRGYNGYFLVTEINSGAFESWVRDPATGIASGDQDMLMQCGTTLQAWYKRLYGAQDNSEQSWVTENLEYTFSCAAPASAGKQTILAADQYDSGHLDWYSFDVDSSQTKLTDEATETITDAPATEKLISFIPSPAVFAGMPEARYWEMEDRKTDFGAINANTTDLLHLLIAEFGLISGNDWFLLPYQMNPGTICAIKGMMITDTFGERTFIRAAGEGPDDDWQTWKMYNLSVKGEQANADNRLLLIPSTIKVMESDPIEKVNFIRDEMANMVWGIENTISLPSGNSQSGYEAATTLRNYFAGAPATPTPPGTAATYQLGTSVPENWIPFISVHTTGSDRNIQMQRAGMPRTVDSSNTLIQPRSSILAGAGPFYIHEEEVPRSGTIVTQSYQRTRWYNGKVVHWVGRKTGNGKGEGDSGLRWDLVE